MISVLMPYYNPREVSEKIWRTCIESILSQSYKEFVLIAVDDFSTDGSQDILREYKDSRIKHIRNSIRIGLTRSLNSALSMANSIYLARHDSDDFSDNLRFEKQVDFLTKHLDISVVGSHANVYDLALNKYDIQKKKLSHSDIYAEARKANPMLHGSVMMRTQSLRDVGGYDTSFVVCQDYDLWSRMLRKGYKFANIDEYLYNRVSHQNCATKTNRIYRKSALDRIRKSWR